MSRDKKRGKPQVWSSLGKNMGPRCVMYCRETRTYIGMDCSTTTKDRFWAWSGTREQARNARSVFGIGEEFQVFTDGQEVENG